MRLSVTRLFPATLASLVLIACGAAAEPSDWPNLGPHVAPALGGVLREAANRLATPECSALLHDYVDFRRGRPLSETLSASGLDLDGWLRSLYFLNGNGRTGCSDGRTLAYTPTGSTVVWVCPLALERARRSSRGVVANVLIHETLHSLGLAEDPPSSEEITLQVRIRCGR